MTTTNSPNLRVRYGKLTVLKIETIDSRPHATVRCACGTEKVVLAANLRAGRIQSCGHTLCRPSRGVRVKRDKTYRPQGPIVVSKRRLRSLWNAYTSTEPGKRQTRAALARKHGLKYQTIVSLFNAITKAGGIDNYMDAIA